SRVEDFWSAQHEGRKFGSLGICESLGVFLVRHRIPFSLDQIAHRVGGFMRGVFRRLFGPFLLFRHFVRLPGYVIFSHGFCSLSAINPYRASPLEMSWGASLLRTSISLGLLGFSFPDPHKSNPRAATGSRLYHRHPSSAGHENI